MRGRVHIVAAILLVLASGGLACSDQAPAPTAPAGSEPGPRTETAAPHDAPEPATPTAAPDPRVPGSRPAPVEPEAVPAPTYRREPAPSTPPEKPGEAEPDAATPGAPLDFDALARRLEKTDAIGLLTKLKLKNEFDDLVRDLRVVHSSRSSATLAQLRERYDLLLMKVIALIQDRDAELSRELVSSRDAIWERLADPTTLAGS